MGRIFQGMFAAFVTTLVLAIHATAAADIPVFPKRPEWDDVPLPMPPELIAIVLLALTAGVVVAARRRQDPRSRD